MSGAEHDGLNLPWQGSPVGCGAYSHTCKILGRYGTVIAEIRCKGRDKAEARRDLIVKACNSHDELVSALSHLVYALDNPVMGSMYEISRSLPSARAALAKAQGRTHLLPGIPSETVPDGARDA